MFFIEHEGSWVGMDKNGDIVLEVPFKNFAQSLREERLGFHENGKRGIKDFAGIVICPAMFDRVAVFSEGMSRVEIDGKTGYVDRDGRLIVPCSFYNGWPFSGGLAAVQETMMSPWGYLNLSGEYQIAPRFSRVMSFTEGLGGVTVDDKWGFLNPAGDFVIEPKYAMANSFSEGVSAVATSVKALKYGFIDHTGSYRIKPNFQGPDMKFSEGRAAVYGKNGFGFIDATGSWVIESQFYNANHFSEGLCAVAVKKGKQISWGFINKQGELVIKMQFKVVTDFRDGVAMAEAKDCWGFINQTGEFIWKTTEPRG